MTRMLLGGTLGLYAGWTTAAVWLNCASLLPELGLDLETAPGRLVLAGLLLSAIVTVALGVRAVRGQWGYVTASGWALTGVVVGTMMARDLGLATLAATGLGAVLAYAASQRRVASGPDAVPAR